MTQTTLTTPADREAYFKQFDSDKPYTTAPENVKNIQSQGFKEFTEVSINWTLNNECQLNCIYCYAKEDMKVQKPEANKSLRSLNRIKVPFNICLLGGEPTLHSDIDEIIEGLVDIEYCHDIDLTTNLFKNIEFWKKYNIEEYFNKLNINASYHPEYDVNFLEKAIILNNMKYINIQCNINILPEQKYYKKTKELIQELKQNNISFSLTNIHETETYKPKYTKEFIQEYKDTEVKYKYNIDNTEQWYTLTEIMKYKLNRFQGYKCTAQDLIITQEGDIKNMCTLKTILLYNETARDTLIVCPNESCSCNTMLRFWKEK